MRLNLPIFVLTAATATLAFPGFDASKQCLDLTDGLHKFVPPGRNDIRGICPGLNIMANQ
jgi:hypothetical protein